MLNSLWQTVVRSDEYDVDKEKFLRDDATDYTTENEDELADKLLTQFPVYGSRGTEGGSAWLEEDLVEDPMLIDEAALMTAASTLSAGREGEPEHPSSPSSTKPTLNWDAQEEGLWKSKTLDPGIRMRPLQATLAPPSLYWNDVQHKIERNVTPTKPEQFSNSGGLFSLTSEKDASEKDDRQHWMPDKLCKQCYACELFFTVFRRRHHCRLCGQVFCSSCSAYFVEWGEGEHKTLRACQLCFDQVNRGALVLPERIPTDVTAIVTPHHREQPLLDPMDEFLDTAKKPTSSIHTDAEETAAAAAVKTTMPSANRHLGLTAASHLERIGNELLHSDSPLLVGEYPDELGSWLNTLMTLATKCVSTVTPNVKSDGDLMDIRPYCKLKVIPGGSHKDCAYLSGVLFRKHVSHKRMAKEILNPRIMLLSGGIEFTRTENRIASLDTLLEQEEKYMEILVGKILKLKPHVLLVGRSVSRKAQELLLRQKVVLLQHVKSSLMRRISRQTGATIISSTDHIMNQFGSNVLGKCRRFRLVTFRDNEAWVDGEQPSTCRALVVKNDSEATPVPTVSNQRSIQAMLQDSSLKNYERQAVLAANMLGENVLDGTEAVKRGLAKRGVTQTYVMLEGCPKHLGCTVVLRGASRASLKQLKRVFLFIANVAYNLKLETCYLRERCARLPAGYEETKDNLFSSSLCVNYGSPPSGRKIRPWNGGNHETVQRSLSGEITALDHQSILITSVWMADKNQCCPAEIKGICYYSRQDVTLGQFLRDSCFNLSLKCQNPTCKKSVIDHSLCFIHNDGLINITVEHMDDPLPPAPFDNKDRGSAKPDSEDQDLEDSPIATWTYCNNCAKVVTPLVYISEDTWKFSFGKFLESFFYNRAAVMNAPEHGCSCPMQTSATLYFGCGRLAARFTYESLKPFGVFVRRNLPIDESIHRAEALRQLEVISEASSELFVKFDEHIEKVSREARSLFGSAANRPEHLQMVLSELNTMGSEVDHASKSLQEKIASFSDKCREQAGSDKDSGSIVNEAIFRFPWYSRRYLYMLTSSWNERLSVAGQAISAMKKLATSSSSSGQRSDGVTTVVPAIVGDASSDDVMDGMRRLRQLNEVYSRYNVTDIGAVLPSFPGIEAQPKEIEYDDDIEDPEGAIDFSDGVDADVLASRRRLYNSKQVESLPSRGERRQEYQEPKKSLGTKRGSSDSTGPSENVASSMVPPRDVASPSSSNKNKTVTPGGAVKSAITRFFNRGGKEKDPYVVDLGIIKKGRPRLEPGAGGIVVPVIDEQPSTVIAYSLSSAEYVHQFKKLSRVVTSPTGDKPSQPGVSARSADDPQKAPERPQSSSASGNQPNSRREDSKGSRTADSTTTTPAGDERKDIERRMLVRSKSHIKHTFRDFDDKGQQTCKFVCTTYWATQFHALRQAFLAPSSKESSGGNPSSESTLEVEKCYVQSLSSAYSWDASGGKSGASFARTLDDRFVIKCISRTELQMFLDCAPAYFEYLSKAFFHGLPTVLCKIVGVYQIGYHNRVTGKRTMEQVAVMQNIFCGKKITKTFDLKGSLKGRFARLLQSVSGKDSALESETRRRRSRSTETASDSELSGDEYVSSDNEDESPVVSVSITLLDGDFLEFTSGRPLPLTDRAKAVFHMSVLNDTLFLSIINVLDYSILVGIDEENMELVVGIIDFMRQYDILKQMERVGKSLPMVVGSEAPTIIQPPLYKARFTNAMERYFMTVPCKWTTI